MSSNRRSELVVALGGRTTAGKSTVAATLSEMIGWPVASFGEYVRDEARLRREALERETLQELGARLITELGWHEFCLHCLRHAGLSAATVPCIVEGIRHREALTTLRELFSPVPVLFVHLEVSDAQRNERLHAQGIASERGSAWEKHATERDALAGVLSSQADLVLTTSDVPRSTADSVLEWLRTHMLI